MSLQQPTFDLSAKISAAFRDIEKDIPTGSGGLYERRLDINSCVPIYLALESPKCLPQLLVTIPKNFFHLISLEETEGFSLSISREAGSTSSFKLCIQISDKRFYELFLVLIQDLIETLLKQPVVKNAIESFVDRIEHWKRFLKKSAKKILSYEEQLGLAGELWLLKLIINSRGHQFALDSWKGPLGAAQDFHCGKNLIEVKSSTVSHQNEIKISSEYQLDAPPNLSLFLYHCIFDPSNDPLEGYTLPILISKIEKKMSEEHKVKFNGLLKCLGYFQDDELEYQANIFKLVKSNFYLVNEDFPSLVSSKLAKPIYKVIYRISTDELDSFLIDGNNVIAGAN
jgi:hypothetical protein